MPNEIKTFFYQLKLYENSYTNLLIYHWRLFIFLEVVGLKVSGLYRMCFMLIEGIHLGMIICSILIVCHSDLPILSILILISIEFFTLILTFAASTSTFILIWVSVFNFVSWFLNLLEAQSMDCLHRSFRSQILLVVYAQ